MILHIGTNNCKNQTPDEVLHELLQLKNYISSVLPTCTVIISQPIARYDDRKSSESVKSLIKKLNLLEIPMIDNSNIEDKHISNGGLHLNQHGIKRIALNIITFLRNF